MKTFLAFVLLLTLISCSKESLTEPQKTATTVNSTATLASYKDANITIKNFAVTDTAGQIEVGFTTVFENNVKTLEILRGLTTTTLCSIYKQDISNNGSVGNTKYSTLDTADSNGNTLYYMIKYTLENGDWSYTPVITLKQSATASN